MLERYGRCACGSSHVLRRVGPSLVVVSWHVSEGVVHSVPLRQPDTSLQKLDAVMSTHCHATSALYVQAKK